MARLYVLKIVLTNLNRVVLDPEWRPHQYSFRYPNTRLNFEFSVTQLESLGEALLDFTAMEDLLDWLNANCTARG